MDADKLNALEIAYALGGDKGHCPDVRELIADYKELLDRNQSVGAQALVDRVNNVIKIHKDAGDINNAEAIGALEIVKLDLYGEICEDEDLTW